MTDPTASARLLRTTSASRPSTVRSSCTFEPKPTSDPPPSEIVACCRRSRKSVRLIGFVYSVRRRLTLPLTIWPRLELCTTSVASAVERKSCGNGTVTCSACTFRRYCDGVKPASSAPPVTPKRPPPSVPVSDSISARSAVKRIVPLMFCAVSRSLPSSVCALASATVTRPVTRGLSNVPATRASSFATPVKKLLRERPFRTLRLRSPLTVKFCRPPAPRAAVPPKTRLVEGPVKRVRSKVISLGVNCTTRGFSAVSCTSSMLMANSVKVAVPRSALKLKPSLRSKMLPAASSVPVARPATFTFAPGMSVAKSCVRSTPVSDVRIVVGRFSFDRSTSAVMTCGCVPPSMPVVS